MSAVVDLSSASCLLAFLRVGDSSTAPEAQESLKLKLNEISTQFVSATSSLFGEAQSGQHILFEPISE